MLELATETPELGHVANDGDRAWAALEAEGAQADLDGNGGAVVSHRDQVESNPHRANMGTRKVAVTQRGMGGADVIGNQDLDRLTDESLRLMPEKPHALSIGEDDAPIG